MARPRIELDWSKLDAILQYGAFLRDCANVMGCSEDTIEKRIIEEKGVGFTEYRAQKMSGVKFTLIQKAIQMAKTGNTTMMIFCLKNLAGWSDKNEVSQESKIEVVISEQDKQL